MPVLNVNVKRAVLDGPGEKFNTYIVTKLHNVKSTTKTVRGSEPTWDQEFVFETNPKDTVLTFELFNKGVLWDKLIGVHIYHLSDTRRSDEDVGQALWVVMDSVVITKHGEPCSTQFPTDHRVLLDIRLDPQSDGASDDADAHLEELGYPRSASALSSATVDPTNEELESEQDLEQDYSNGGCPDDDSHVTHDPVECHDVGESRNEDVVIAMTSDAVSSYSVCSTESEPRFSYPPTHDLDRIQDLPWISSTSDGSVELKEELTTCCQLVDLGCLMHWQWNDSSEGIVESVPKWSTWNDTSNAADILSTVDVASSGVGTPTLEEETSVEDDDRHPAFVCSHPSAFSSSSTSPQVPKIGLHQNAIVRKQEQEEPPSNESSRLLSTLSERDFDSDVRTVEHETINIDSKAGDVHKTKPRWSFRKEVLGDSVGTGNSARRQSSRRFRKAKRHDSLSALVKKSSRIGFAVQSSLRNRHVSLGDWNQSEHESNGSNKNHHRHHHHQDIQWSSATNNHPTRQSTPSMTTGPVWERWYTLALLARLPCAAMLLWIGDVVDWFQQWIYCSSF